MILLPAIMDGYRSLKDKTLKISFTTNEIPPNQFTELAAGQSSFGYLAFKPEPFTDTEKDTLEALKTDFEDTGKTPGQRLRAVLYRMYEQEKEGYKTFFDYYNSKMEQLINHYKKNLI